MTGIVVAALSGVVAAFLLAMSAAALGRLGSHRAKNLAVQGRAGSTALLQVSQRHSEAVAVLTFLRVLAETATAVLVTIGVAEVFADFWKVLGASTAIMVVTSFILVGVSPRTLGQQHIEIVALSSARVVLFLVHVLGPLSRLLVAFGNAVTPGKGFRDGPFDSEGELRELVDIAEHTDLIEDEERRMIHSVFDLDDTLAREVMVPRTDIVVISQDFTLAQAIRVFSTSGFSRIPVVGNGKDDIRGVLYFKDVVARNLRADVHEDDPAVTAMRPVVFVPESKPADDLLRDMQRDRAHLAVVVDEYGGTAGVLTIEDILEEIVGEIDDEHDRVTPTIEELPAGEVRVPARMSIDEMSEYFGVEIVDDEVDSVGGLLGKIIGAVPLPGDSGQIAGLTLTAEKMAGRRHQLASVLVSRVANSSAGGSEEALPSSQTGNNSRQELKK